MCVIRDTCLYSPEVFTISNRLSREFPFSDFKTAPAETLTNHSAQMCDSWGASRVLRSLSAAALLTLALQSTGSGLSSTLPNVTSRRITVSLREVNLRGRTSLSVWLIGCSLCYSALLICAITGRSLWTDEAFSAYIASQPSLGSVTSILSSGNTFDLLTPLHYIYLHFWAVLFGTTEYALRSANVPFIILFALALVGTSLRVFKSRWVWAVAGLIPFSWSHAGEARSYFVLLALSTVCFACLLAYGNSPTEREMRWIPWIVLASVFLGLAFNVLMLLAVAPLACLMCVLSILRPGSIAYLHWRRPLLAFAIPFALYSAFVTKALTTHAGSEYAEPSALSVLSVLYRFVGLGGFGPNRRYDIPFGPYLPGMMIGAILTIAVVLGIAFLASRLKWRVLFTGISLALGLSLLQVIVLSFVLKQQADERHLAALAPLLAMLVMAALSGSNDRAGSKVSGRLAGLIAIVWLSSDLRLLFMPEYRSQGQDFRSVIARSIALHNRDGSEIALVADPAAGAYYGLDLTGDSPCFPLGNDCSRSLSGLAWVVKRPPRMRLDGHVNEQKHGWIVTRRPANP